MFEKFNLSQLRTLYRDTKGGALIYTALTIPALIGFAGLAVDVSLWHVQKRESQTMADAGAISAAQDVIRFGDMLGIDGAALDGASLNGFLVSTDNIVVNNPPLQGGLVGDPEGIEVIIDVPAGNFLSSMFVTGNRVRSRAVVRVFTRPGDTCIMTLDPNNDGSLTIQGNSQTNLDCGAVVNSVDDEAFIQNGGTSCFLATSIMVSGGLDPNLVDMDDPLTEECEGVGPEPSLGFAQQFDPLRAMGEMDDDEAGACDESSKVVVTDGELRDFTATRTYGAFPDVAIFNFCNGLTINGNTAVVNFTFDRDLFAAAIFYFKSGLFKINGGFVFGDDVMFYLGADSDGVDMTGGQVVFSAAGLEDVDDDGYDERLEGYEYRGILFFEDPDFVDNGQERTNKLNGGAGTSFEGISYFPASTVQFTGDSGAFGSSIIAHNITISGNSTLGSINSIILQNLLAIKIVQLVE